MTRVRYTPQAALPGHRIVYTWQGRVLTVALYRGDEVVGQETYDLSTLQPGDEVVGVEPEALPFSPLISARCAEDETLEVVLLHWYDGGEEPELAEEVLGG
jgi:hypothetical protein